MHSATTDVNIVVCIPPLEDELEDALALLEDELEDALALLEDELEDTLALLEDELMLLDDVDPPTPPVPLVLLVSFPPTPDGSSRGS